MSETTNIRREFDHDGWKLTLDFNNKAVVKKLGESREYDFPPITKIEHDNEYVFFTHEDLAFSQIKFEEGNFLVIDLFDKNGEHLAEKGSHVFGEDLELDEANNCIYCGQDCYNGDMCDEQQAGGFNE